MRPVVELRDASVGRSGRLVVTGVDLAVAPGERVGIVGTNGSGKTTLLRALAGLDRPCTGTIRWLGRTLPLGAARVRVVGVLLQSEPLSSFTVREVVTLGLGLDGPPSALARRCVDAVLEEHDLVSLADRRCMHLSGGEAQRVLLARALVARPALLLLDEPTNHLDPAHRAALLGCLDRLRGRVAVVLATHDLALAATCDRVVLLHAGRIATAGRAAAVLTPPHLRTALGVRVRRVDDPQGGPPLLRVEPA